MKMEEKYFKKIVPQLFGSNANRHMTDILTSLYFLGRPLSPLYSLLMRMRSRFYINGKGKRERMPVPVISVGNLTMGGTGKTPIVRHIARMLAKNNFHPAIISRGYGGKAREKINVVSDGNTVFMDAGEAGDEPLLLAESLPGTPVVTGAARSFPCHFAVEHLGCDVLILDDGFQHLPVARDVDLVLFNAAAPLGNNRVFPGGDLREPISALHRAHAFILTGVSEDTQPHVHEFALFLKRNFPGRPLFFSAYTPLEFRKHNESRSVPLSELSLPAFAFCGIANPMRFLNTLHDIGIAVKGFDPLKDHQNYRQEIMDKISRSAETMGAQALITTEKDMVKLRGLHSPLPLYSLTMSVDIEDAFSDYLLNRLSGTKLN